MRYSAKYVRDLKGVRKYLREKARPICLSQEPAPNHTIAGIVPRIRRTPPYHNAPGTATGGPYPMHVEGNAESPKKVQAQALAMLQTPWLNIKPEPREIDAFFGLHGFQVVSDVVAAVIKTQRKGMYQVRFDKWICKVTDQYHWNPTLRLKVPNPDYGSKASGAIMPKNKIVTVYHKNALRLENAGMAKPFFHESDSWLENDLTVMGHAIVYA